MTDSYVRATVQQNQESDRGYWAPGLLIVQAPTIIVNVSRALPSPPDGTAWRGREGPGMPPRTNNRWARWPEGRLLARFHLQSPRVQNIMAPNTEQDMSDPGIVSHGFEGTGQATVIHVRCRAAVQCRLEIRQRRVRPIGIIRSAYRDTCLPRSVKQGAADGLSVRTVALAEKTTYGT